MTTAPISIPPVPAVSVLMAVHNGMPYAESALRSMMEQTLRNIEIIVVDDASNDETPVVLARLAAEDLRIRIETLDTNLGLPGALNRGLELTRAPYVARMDADDLSMPNRLEVQKAWLDRHPQVVLAGTSIRKIDADGRVFHTAIRARDAVAVRWMARFHMPLVHPTFMFRNPGPEGRYYRYDPALRVSQDYDFVARVLESGDVVSLPDVLLDYRVHTAAASRTSWLKQQQIARDIAARVMVAQLPEQIRKGLAPLSAALHSRSPTDPAKLFAGLRKMLAWDQTQTPAHKVWMRRQAAQIAFKALQRAGLGKAQLLRAFAFQGADFLLPMGFRYLETQQKLPKAMRSDPHL